MVESLGWLGFIIFAGTLIPLFLRRFAPRKAVTTIFTRLHQKLALICLVVLALHGILALIGRHGHGWHWGRGVMTMTGIISWLGLLAVVLLALVASRKKPFPRIHCWVVIVPVVAILSHVF